MKKELFIKFLLDSGALKLNNPNDPEGLFTLKSGRRSPFFMNMGDLNTSEQLVTLGAAYAGALNDCFKNVDVVFGPAYKGIPLAAATAMQYNLIYKKSVRYCADRKEVKDHGDGGALVGTKLKDGDRIVIIEDVTTSGKSISEVMPKIKAAADVKVVGLIVSFDRMEYGKDKSMTALDEIEAQYGIDAYSIVSIADVLQYADLPEKDFEKFRLYYKEYGVEGMSIT